MSGNDVQDPFSPQRRGRSALWQRGSNKQRESTGSTCLLPGSPAAKSFVLVLHPRKEHPTSPASWQTRYETLPNRGTSSEQARIYSVWQGKTSLGLVYKMDASTWDFLGTHTPTCARTPELAWPQDERMCKHTAADAPALPRVTILCQVARARPGYYLHWKTLESTARCMQLKHFLPLSTQRHYMPNRRLQRRWGEVEEFRKSPCLCTTHCFIVLVFSCSPSRS